MEADTQWLALVNGFVWETKWRSMNFRSAWITSVSTVYWHGRCVQVGRFCHLYVPTFWSKLNHGVWPCVQNEPFCKLKVFICSKSQLQQLTQSVAKPGGMCKWCMRLSKPASQPASQDRWQVVMSKAKIKTFWKIWKRVDIHRNLETIWKINTISIKQKLTETFWNLIGCVNIDWLLPKSDKSYWHRLRVSAINK